MTPVRVAAVSDLHGHLPRVVPECDVLVIAGDIIPPRREYHTLTKEWQVWFHGTFRDWLHSLDCAVVGVAGNHDFVLQRHRNLARQLPWNYLQDRAVTLHGLKFYGTPWTPPFMDWAFMKREEVLTRVYAQIDEDTDVLVTHGPPRGSGDLVTGVFCHYRVGSEALAHRIQELPQLQLHLFGHTHLEGGLTGLYPTQATRWANVAHVGENYQPREAPIPVFDVVPRTA